MLYDGTQFSSNGKDTMTKRDGSKLPSAFYKNGMNPADVVEINNLYHCTSPTTTTARPQQRPAPIVIGQPTRRPAPITTRQPTRRPALNPYRFSFLFG